MPTVTTSQSLGALLKSARDTEAKAVGEMLKVAPVLGKQGLRSGTSVGANYREVSRGRSKAEFISNIGDCLKEIEETEYWLELLVDNRCVPGSQMADLLDETRQLIAIFTTIDNRSKGNL